MRRALSGLILLAVSGCAMVSGQDSRPDYLVFFTEHSALLDDVAVQVVAKAAADARATPSALVTVLGFTDSAGNAGADEALSQRRASSVADALIADGVPASRITRQGRGQTHEDPGVASRRVEILVGS